MNSSEAESYGNCYCDEIDEILEKPVFNIVSTIPDKLIEEENDVKSIQQQQGPTASSNNISCDNVLCPTVIHITEEYDTLFHNND